jgi:glucoamylase
VASDRTTVSGTTTPGALVDVSATAANSGDNETLETRAGSDGSFAVDVPTPFGTSVITVAATTPDGRTGYQQRTVVSDVVTGTTVLDVPDPDGDDNGPGTYAYPTSADFHPGAFDIQRFQVIDAGDTVYLRTRLRDLTPTFGSPLGAQLLDVFVHDPAAAATSSQAPYPSRNYTIAAQDAWSSRIEAQGFADPVFVDASGASLGTATVLADQTSRTITIAVPASALGHPGSGWSFAVVLHGQEGASPDRARGFAATAQPFQFGVCASGVSSPICSVDPASVAKAMDVITPAGVDQDDELDPTNGPVVLRGVQVP